MGNNIVTYFALLGFKIESAIEVLIKNGVIDKDEFRKLVLQKIDQGKDEGAKEKMRESIDKLLK